MAQASVNLMQLTPKADVLYEMTRNDSQCVVQDHSRSAVLVPTDMPDE